MGRELVPPDEFDTSDQYTMLEWRFTDHGGGGETALFEVCGLRAWVGDYDGDYSEWRIRKGKSGPILAGGNRYDGNHFFICLQDAEKALRRIVAERIAELRGSRLDASHTTGAGR